MKISYKIKFTDKARFMASSSPNLIGNLAEGIHKTKCKDYNCFLEYGSVNVNLIKYKFYLVIKTIQTRLIKN